MINNFEKKKEKQGQLIQLKTYQYLSVLSVDAIRVINDKLI